ncbi:MAG: 2-methylcitrate dehydratase [Gammaproteobacteria bacterium]|nr:2-methylcitrate dehydratase [Gammaproteobacteria bacterium]
MDYPVGHRRRRDEGIPLLLEKYERSLNTHFDGAHVSRILESCNDRVRLESMPVHEFMDLWVAQR